MNYLRPSGSPPCWGQKYQEGEAECMQCDHRNSCQQEMIRMTTSNVSLPVIRNYSPPITPQRTTPTTVVPLPSRPYYAPPAPTIPLPKPPTQSTFSTTQLSNTAPQASYYQSSTGHAIPNTTTPSPFAHWQRPGAPTPSYYFTQYPEENVSTRLIKNALLRALEAIFAELMQFFRHWTWPSK